MSCENCAYWTPGSNVPFSNPPLTAIYGLCRPQFGLLPFWAVRWQRDMQTNTRPDEGFGCPALSERRQAA